MGGFMGGMYGGLMGGMCGMGGLMGGMYGGLMGGMYGIGGMGGLGSLGMLSLLGNTGLSGSTATPAAVAVAAEQAGTWDGLWSTGLVSGPMTLNLIEDPIFGTLTGFVQLLGNPTLGSLVDVTGEILNNQIFVSGSGIGLGGMTFKIDVTGTLTSPETMTGNYTLINSSSLVETGAFELALIPPIIF